MTSREYDDLLEIARRYTRVSHEAHDLLQDALIVSIEENRYDFSIDANRSWIRGVIRNLASQVARTSVRRKQRENGYSNSNLERTTDPEMDSDHHEESAGHRFLHALSPAARSVAVLILHGLNRKEIGTVLSLSDTALRQRLTSIRKALAPLSPEIRQDIIAMAYASREARKTAHADLPMGLIRKTLMKRLAQERAQGYASIGTHDPSGHLIVISEKK